MAKNTGNFSMEDAKRLSETEAGRKLISLLRLQDPQQLQSAMRQASSGNFEQLKLTLSTFMASQEAQSLLKQLEKSSHE